MPLLLLSSHCSSSTYSSLISLCYALLSSLISNQKFRLPKKWETIKGVLQLPKFSLQSSVDLRYLCHSKSGDGSDAIGPGEVIKFITSGSVLRHLSSLDLSRCSFLTTEQIMSIYLPYHFFLSSLFPSLCSVFCFFVFF